MTQIHNLNLPVSPQQIKEVKTGDLVYISGIICTGRDHFHKRLLEYHKHGKDFPASFSDLKGGAIYHMGPIVKENENGGYSIISGGPTTSARMNPFQTDVCRLLSCNIVIGKGGMTDVEWSKIPAIYLQYPGGAGALVSKFITKVKSVEWLDLGSPEAAWFLEVSKFGPLVVTIDSNENSLYDR
ncbi:Putative L(+)-tartrate dehydratase subunit beta [Candidatus Lokiarchaeum ossiferum]|uniref:L(+)-tartrate dehydratase subunit beta n=1 Tax=Candidatus Lokiarchaeum ossiferum TaxID=2951803 RepID=A0ABY6HRM3_9ARCH|nr:Putative L(+)-tartrate dehydratase subunit beta [Candidatus Lokiarchaeum sp. B-35]